jgi:hypothetical protein
MRFDHVGSVIRKRESEQKRQKNPAVRQLLYLGQSRNGAQKPGCTD